MKESSELGDDLKKLLAAALIEPDGSRAADSTREGLASPVSTGESKATSRRKMGGHGCGRHGVPLHKLITSDVLEEMISIKKKVVEIKKELKKQIWIPEPKIDETEKDRVKNMKGDLIALGFEPTREEELRVKLLKAKDKRKFKNTDLNDDKLKAITEKQIAKLNTKVEPATYKALDSIGNKAKRILMKNKKVCKLFDPNLVQELNDYEDGTNENKAPKRSEPEKLNDRPALSLPTQSGGPILYSDLSMHKLAFNDSTKYD